MFHFFLKYVTNQRNGLGERKKSFNQTEVLSFLFKRSLMAVFTAADISETEKSHIKLKSCCVISSVGGKVLSHKQKLSGFP